MESKNTKVLSRIFECRSIDDLSLQDGVDYRLLGLIWQNIVEDKLTSQTQVLSNILQSKIIELQFKQKQLISDLKPEVLSNTNQDYFVFDGFVTVISDNYTSAIIEIKLGLQNIGLKEMEYLYYNPHAMMVVILFYPDRIDRPMDVYKQNILPLVDQFNKEYLPPTPLEVSNNRIQFVDRYQIELQEVTEKKLREYQTRVDYYTKIVLHLLELVYPRSLVKADLLDITEGHHEVIGNILQNLLTNSLISAKTCDIMNKIDRISKDVTLYSLSHHIHRDSQFQDLVSNLELDIDKKLLEEIPKRECYNGLRPNDRSILCYLHHYPDQWISVPDLLHNVTFDSQGEMRRRLEDLTKDGIILDKKGFQLDLEDSYNTSPHAHFYRLHKLPEGFSGDDCVCNNQPPQQIYTQIQITVNELSILFLLENQHISKQNPVTMSDVATTLSINQSTVNIALKRLSGRSDIPINLINGWVLSRGKKVRLRSSPVAYLSGPLPDELNALKSQLKVPELSRNMSIVPLPLTPSECKVIMAISEGITSLAELARKVRINEIPKSNKYMLKVIVKRLSDAESMEKRGFSAIIKSDPFKLCSSFAEDPAFLKQVAEIQEL